MKVFMIKFSLSLQITTSWVKTKCEPNVAQISWRPFYLSLQVGKISNHVSGEINILSALTQSRRSTTQFFLVGRKEMKSIKSLSISPARLIKHFYWLLFLSAFEIKKKQKNLRLMIKANEWSWSALRKKIDLWILFSFIKIISLR